MRRIKKSDPFFISFAQNLEDFVLWRALKDIKNGFYIDIGAFHPVLHSVSNAFYIRGWRGVNIEANENFIKNFKKYRADEVNERILVSNLKSPVLFYRIDNTGLSTISKKIADKHKYNGYQVKVELLKSVTLDNLLSRYSHKSIHWLKIDVEGGEHNVISSWIKSPVRPWILCIESTEPLTGRNTHASWERQIISKGYKFIYYDGINRFYIHKSKLNLKSAFERPPNVLDKIIPYQFISFKSYLIIRLKLMLYKYDFKKLIKD
jgi:FkbM family methyltransferase